MTSIFYSNIHHIILRKQWEALVFSGSQFPEPRLKLIHDSCLCVTVEPLKCPENKQTRTGHHPHSCLSSEISMLQQHLLFSYSRLWARSIVQIFDFFPVQEKSKNIHTGFRHTGNDRRGVWRENTLHLNGAHVSMQSCVLYLQCLW